MTNLRQILADKKIICRCIRCREAKNLKLNQVDLTTLKRTYLASGGREYFLSFEDRKRDKIFALLRLRLPTKFNPKTTLASIKGCALIREVHTFGQTTPTKLKKNKTIQHLGLGKQLIAAAEKIALKQGFKKMAVISGVGTRGYYRKLGYELGEDGYMFKKLKKSPLLNITVIPF